jgi:hypothetical protein
MNWEREKARGWSNLGFVKPEPRYNDIIAPVLRHSTANDASIPNLVAMTNPGKLPSLSLSLPKSPLPVSRP